MTFRASSAAKILLVDDSLDNQVFLKHLLEARGAFVTVANNGEEGVQLALSGRYDLVLMDMQMPTRDGYTATQNLREVGFSRPIIALTAHAMAEERLKSKAAGCDDHVTKPVNLEQLVQKISRLSGSERVANH